MIKTSLRSIANTFLTGLLAALPLAATVIILTWAVRLAVQWLGPDSFVGGLLVAMGVRLSGSEWVAYLLGLALVMLAIFILGLLVQTRLKAALQHALKHTVQRIPVVRSIYDMIQKFVNLLGQRDANSARSMSPVWLHFGGESSGAAVLGLLSSSDPVLVGGQPYLAVLVPTAPVPVGGALIYVPQAWVSPADVGIDGLTSIYVSMGVTSAQHMPAAAQPPTQGLS
ncbi:DUF502 domain-containing protein [Roseateles sp. BYS180W]|uniref:DUF502 domain-containing protein n=1 Tax=Roseateles rivi TaxID=3299028 RepID=A0ABW7FT01_9BURK